MTSAWCIVPPVVITLIYPSKLVTPGTILAGTSESARLSAFGILACPQGLDPGVAKKQRRQVAADLLHNNAVKMYGIGKEFDSSE